MQRSYATQAAITLIASLSIGVAWAGGGRFGIDQRVNQDDSGIWKRGNQTAPIRVMIGGELVGALWEGGEARPGKTFWESTEVMVWQQLGSQFPSSEVAAVSATCHIRP